MSWRGGGRWHRFVLWLHFVCLVVMASDDLIAEIGRARVCAHWACFTLFAAKRRNRIDPFDTTFEIYWLLLGIQKCLNLSPDLLRRLNVIVGGE